MNIPKKRSWFIKLLESPNLFHYDNFKAECIEESENGGVVFDNEEGLLTICNNQEEVNKWFMENNLP